MARTACPSSLVREVKGIPQIHVDDLVILSAECAISLQYVASQVEVLPIAGGAIELDERHLDLGMPGNDGPLVRPGP